MRISRGNSYATWDEDARVATVAPSAPLRADSRGPACIVTCMTTEADAKAFAHRWIAAWNSHDLDAIMSHYAEDVVLISPTAARLLEDPSGTVEGHTALRNYFKRGLEVYPNLYFELLDVMFGLSSVVVCYKNQKGTKTAEFMEFSEEGRVTRVVANYGGCFSAALSL
jgi:hypothetical protein